MVKVYYSEETQSPTNERGKQPKKQFFLFSWLAIEGLLHLSSNDIDPNQLKGGQHLPTVVDVFLIISLFSQTLALVLWSWETTHVGEVVGLNPGAINWIDIFSHWFAEKIFCLFEETENKRKRSWGLPIFLKKKTSSRLLYGHNIREGI